MISRNGWIIRYNERRFLLKCTLFGQFFIPQEPKTKGRCFSLMSSRHFILLILSFLSRLAVAQTIWEQASGPDGPHDTRAVAVNSHHLIFAATSVGVYMSSNSGTDWKAINTGLTSTDVHSIAVDSKDHIYIGTDLGGVYLSSDNGNSWSQSSIGITSANIYFLSLGPSDVLYAGTPSGHVFRSTDGSKSWVDISPPAADMNALVVDSIGTVFACGSGLFRSLNRGNSWQIGFAHSSTPFKWAAGMAAASHNRIFLCNDSGIFVSSDTGSNWLRLPLGSNSQYPPYQFIHANVTHVACLSNAIISASDIGTKISRDGGNYWASVDTYFDLQFTALGRDSAIQFAANGFGVLQSVDSGASWRRVNSSDLPPCDVNSIAKSTSGHLYAATGCGVYVSTDEGNHWSLSLLGGSDYHGGGYGPVIAPDPNLVLVNFNGDIARSTDGGKGWVGVTSGNYGVGGINANHLFARSTGNAAPNCLVKSLDKGSGWSTVPLPPNSIYIYCFAISPNGDLYTGAENSDNGTGLFRSTNNGDSWQYVAFNGRDVDEISITPRGYIFVDVNGWKYRSTDLGTSWTEIVNGVGAVGNKEGTLFRGNSQSIDIGNTWTDYSSGLPVNWTLGPMAIDSSGRLFGGANGQVFRTVHSTLSVQKNDDQNALNIWPNPTTGIITVVGIPMDAHIGIFDVLGKSVIELKNPSSKELTIDISKFVPGTYYIRFFSPSSVVTKMVVRE